MPGDVGGCGPWAPQEVKWDKRSQVRGRGTRYAGEAFIRATLRDLLKLWHRSLGVGAEQTEPLLWIRGPTLSGVRLEEHYRLFLRVAAWGRAFGGFVLRDALEDGWVEIPPWLFFSDVARKE